MAADTAAVYAPPIEAVSEQDQGEDMCALDVEHERSPGRAIEGSRHIHCAPGKETGLYRGASLIVKGRCDTRFLALL